MENKMKYEFDEMVIIVPSDDESTPPVEVKQITGIVHSTTTIASTENEMPANYSQMAGAKGSVDQEVRHRKKSRFTHRYKCRVCNYAARQKSTLKVHMAVHSGVKFVCDKCDQSFSYKSTLKRHQQRKTKCTSTLPFHGFESSNV